MSSVEETKDKNILAEDAEKAAEKSNTDLLVIRVLAKLSPLADPPLSERTLARRAFV